MRFGDSYGPETGCIVKVVSHERSGAIDQAHRGEPSRSTTVSHPAHMSATGHTTDAVSSLDDLPEFELSYHFDDETEPETVTIFQPGTDEQAATRWITIDYKFSVPIDAIR